MFTGDRPILKSSQDKLNRSLFAKYLARSILDHTDPDSFVVGLYGTWGVGKTSIINLVLEELQFAASNLENGEKPIILNFSPWSYSGQNELIYSFFRRLSSALRQVDYLENAERIIYLLELYVSFFTHKPIPRALRTKQSLLNRFLQRDRAAVYGWESGRDLTLVKAELNTLLSKQKHKIIIIIDNIARLYPAEMKQIFQIVKSMGDYANTAYLLALDKQAVIQAMNTLHIEGEAFLEKMVQLPFDIPPILSQDIENILADRLLELIALVPEDTWDALYWSDLYYNAIKYFFQNCRDITRYINTLQFSYARLRHVVNPMDFFALTAIEIFTPEVYDGIRDNKDLFTDLLDPVYTLTDTQRKQEKIQCDAIIERSQRVSKEIMLELLLCLFPRLKQLYQPEMPFYYNAALAQTLRHACNPASFDLYFRLSIKTGYMLKTEFENILSLASDQISFNQTLSRLIQEKNIIKFLDLLDNYTLRHLPEQNIPVIINAFMDHGDLFPEGMIGPLNLETAMRLHRIITILLKRIPSSEMRLRIMQEAITKTTNSLYTLVYAGLEFEHEHETRHTAFLPEAFRIFTPAQFTILKQSVSQQITTWAQDMRLSKHPKLLFILKAWNHFEGSNACQPFIQNMMQTDRGFLMLLCAALAQPITDAMTQYKINPAWKEHIDVLNTLIPVTQLTDHAKTLFEDPYFEKLDESEQLALMIFLELTHVKTNKMIPKTTV